MRNPGINLQNLAKITEETLEQTPESITVEILVQTLGKIPRKSL